MADLGHVTSYSTVWMRSGESSTTMRVVVWWPAAVTPVPLPKASPKFHQMLHQGGWLTDHGPTRGDLVTCYVCVEDPPLLDIFTRSPPRPAGARRRDVFPRG